jgi:hypothetical protein
MSARWARIFERSRRALRGRKLRSDATHVLRRQRTANVLGSNNIPAGAAIQTELRDLWGAREVRGRAIRGRCGAFIECTVQPSKPLKLCILGSHHANGERQHVTALSHCGYGRELTIDCSTVGDQQHRGRATSSRSVAATVEFILIDRIQRGGATLWTILSSTAATVDLALPSVRLEKHSDLPRSSSPVAIPRVPDADWRRV